MAAAEFIEVAIDAVLDLLETRTAGVLAEIGPSRKPFTQWGKNFRVAFNSPEGWVEPVNTLFDDEGSTIHQMSQLKVTLAISGPDPDGLTEAVLDYVRAVDLVIRQNETLIQDDRIKRVFIREHNYGGLRKGVNSGFGAFPEIYLLVEMEELP